MTLRASTWALLALLHASLALAQEPAPETPPPADTKPPAETKPAAENKPPVDAKAPVKASSVVVYSDALDDETENAKLRARVYEVARKKGLMPDPGADVAATAQAKGALEEGRVSANESALEGVRGALGLEFLVRVAKKDGGLQVLVLRAGAAPKSKRVASAEAVPGAVAELLGLPASAAAAPPAAAGGQAGSDISAGLILRPKRESDEPELSDPKALGAAWHKRGGLRASYGVHAVLTGLMIPETQYASQNPVTGQMEVGKKTTYGIGGGIGLDLSMMYLPPPDPISDTTSFAAFRLGLRLDLNGLYVRPPEKFTYKDVNGVVESRDTTYDNIAYIYGVLPIQAGVHFGFGDFRLPTLWRGLGLGLAYSPAWIFTLKVGEKEDTTDSMFNYAGFELSLDIAKLQVEKGSEPQIRLSVLVLPRVKDDLPWLASAGIGAIWY